MAEDSRERYTKIIQAISQADDSRRIITKVKREEYLKILKEFRASEYSKMMSYSNLVILAGYVAFYSSWKYFYNELPRFAMLLCFLFVSLSLVLFISNEVYKMLSFTEYQQNINKALQLRDVDAIQAKIREIETDYDTRNYKIWSYIVWPTIILSVSAGLLIIVSLSYEIVIEIIRFVRNL